MSDKGFRYANSVSWQRLWAWWSSSFGTVLSRRLQPAGESLQPGVLRCSPPIALPAADLGVHPLWVRPYRPVGENTGSRAPRPDARRGRESA